MNFDRVRTIQEAVENKGFEFYIVSDYGDKNYSIEGGKEGVILSDWNQFDKYPNIVEYLEKYFELDWEDEFVIDYENDVAYRSQPDSYGWQPEFVIIDGEIVGVDELNNMNDEDFREFLENERYLNNPKTAINLNGFEPRGTDIIDEDYHMFEYEPDPEKILKEFKEQYPDKDFYFVIGGVAQFGLNFSLYML